MLKEIKHWFNKPETASRRNRDMADEEVTQVEGAMEPEAVDPPAAMPEEPAVTVSPEEVPAEAVEPEPIPETPVEEIGRAHV